ncbi:protein ninH [Erwinia sp. P7711]|uniref:protein ninH n=1 Tax=Erwinia sp. P7711 TaxID=3141451 RepID=UPI00318490FA
MKKDVYTVPELLRRCNGSRTAVGRIVGLDRRTVGVYSDDTEGLRHVIVNGVLMVAQGNRGRRKNA